MGRLAYMYSPRFWMTLAWCAVGAFVLSSCGSVGSPVSITNRPLSEQVEDREAEQAGTTVPTSEDVDGEQSTPEAIAFSDALASGNFLRMNVHTNGVDTTLRAGPGTSYEELTELTDGVELLATGDQTGEWVYVVYGDLEGWVSNRRLVFSEGTEVPAVVRAEDVAGSYVVYEVYNNAVGVNIRASANGGAALVTGASVGDTVIGTGRTDGSWIEITHNGLTGWASGNYLRPVGTQASPGPVDE